MPLEIGDRTAEERSRVDIRQVGRDHHHRRGARNLAVDAAAREHQPGQCVGDVIHGSSMNHPRFVHDLPAIRPQAAHKGLYS